MNTKTARGLDATLIARLLVGLAAGVIYVLLNDYRLDKPLYGFDEKIWAKGLNAAWTAAALAPLPLLFGLGRLPVVRLAAWSTIAALLLALVGWFGTAPVWSDAPPAITVWPFSLITLYIVHEFLQAAVVDGRRIASYETYFDLSWRHAFQAVLAAGFTLAMWIVLWLGAALFALIGLSFLEDLLGKDWFSLPLLATAFAASIHLTDADSGLTRGARQIGLMLLSWLSILMTLILTAFLAALPFTGLEPLWDTKRATVLLLNAAATMILLVNAAFQAGEPPRSPVIRAVVRFSAFPLAGVVALAALGLWLRINQYGLTPARVVAGAELLIVAVYAAGYVSASLRPGPWMALIKPVNIGAAAFVAAILFLLMTPVLDPARVSVDNQVSRLLKGKVEPDDFDFGFLANARAGDWGARALEKLATREGSARDARIAFLAKNPADAPGYGPLLRQSFNERRASVVLLGGGAVPDAAYLAAAGQRERGEPAIDPIADCVRAVQNAAEFAAIKAQQRRGVRGDRDALSDAASGAGHDGATTAPEDVRCRARPLDMDFDGDDDLVVMTSTRWGSDRHHNAYAWHVIVQDSPEQWRVAGARHSAPPRVHTDGETDLDAARAKAEKTFLAARAVASGRLDLMVDGRRRQWKPAPAPVSAADRRASIIMIGGGEPPSYVLEDRPLADIVLPCVRTKDPESPYYFRDERCFGRRLDVDGDGAPEFLLMQFDEFQQPEVQIFSERGGAARPLGVAPSPGFQPDANLRPKESVAARRAAKEAFQNRAAETLTAAPALLADLDLAGTRIVFDYVAAEAGDASPR